MFTRLTALFSVFAILIQMPAVAAESSPPASVIKNEPKTCSTCQAGAQLGGLDRLDLLSRFGNRTRVSPFLPLRNSLFGGTTENFVNTATGALSFAVTDMAVGDAVPVMFQRTYVSTRHEDCGLGAGWSYAFNDRIEINEDTATLTDATGQSLFHRDGQTDRFVSVTNDVTRPQRVELTDANTIVDLDSPVTRIYQKTGRYYVLGAIRGPQGINISIDHDERGYPTRIANTPGAAITLEWVGTKHPHLESVVDNLGHRVTFDIGGSLLRAVSDPTGAKWTYDYSGGLLRRVTDPVGRILLRARYDNNDHVIEAGDGIALNHYEYRAASLNALARTVVTDPLGLVTTYEHNGRGALTTIKDDEGKSLQFEYTQANRPARFWDSANEVRFGYDGENRLQTQSTNGTVERAYDYGGDGKPASITEGSEHTEFMLDARGQVISSQSSDPARSYTATYNEQGQMSLFISGGREALFRYDSNGHKASVSYNDGTFYGFQYDAAGHLLSRQFSSGLSLVDERDARGALISERDNRGHAIFVEYDAGGSPKAYTRADGTRTSVVRDEIGRVISLTGFDGKERKFKYDARGALTDYTDSKGSHQAYRYDRRGRLQAIIYDAGATTTIERDERGHIRRLRTERTPSNSVNAFGQRLQSLVTRRWAHATFLQDDPPLPPPDEILDKIITDIWAPYGYGGAGGPRHPPLLATEDPDGSGGGTQDIDCAIALTLCFTGILAYPGLVGALMLACPETFGLGCFAALVAMIAGPVLAILQCARAYRICGLG